MSEENWTRKLEKIIQPWMIVVIFVLVLLFGFYKEATADVTVEVGSGILSGQFSKGAVLSINERFGNYIIGMGYIAKQEVTPRTEPQTPVDENLFVHGQRMVKLWDVDLGLGVAYFNSTNRALGSKFTASLSLEYNFNEHWDIKFRHFSNAGSAAPNMGQDMLLVGYTF